MNWYSLLVQSEVSPNTVINIDMVQSPKHLVDHGSSPPSIYRRRRECFPGFVLASWRSQKEASNGKRGYWEVEWEEIVEGTVIPMHENVSDCRGLWLWVSCDCPNVARTPSEEPCSTDIGTETRSSQTLHLLFWSPDLQSQSGSLGITTIIWRKEIKHSLLNLCDNMVCKGITLFFTLVLLTRVTTLKFCAHAAILCLPTIGISLEVTQLLSNTYSSELPGAFSLPKTSGKRASYLEPPQNRIHIYTTTA